jgi:hypothetical protein
MTDCGHKGYGWNHKRTWRVYCQLCLNLPRKVRQGRVEVSCLRRSGWERTMKKSKFSEEQIAYALRQTDSGTPRGCLSTAWRL